MNTEKPYLIFKDNNGKYKLGLSHKTQDGKKEFAYFPVHFRRGVELENKTPIYIKQYWFDFYNWEYEGKKGTQFYIFINDFKLQEEAKETKKEEPKQENDPYKEFSEENDMELNLPF